MKAIVVSDRATGALTLADRPAPVPSPGEILVRVMCAGVNPVDWKLRSGMLGRVMARRIPEIPGCDVAGIVEAAGGSSASAFPPGTPVVGLAPRGGAYAELALLQEAMVARKPDGLDFPTAASLPVAGLTALQALRDLAHLGSGQKLLVNGASGGVGSFAVQLGRVLGAHVTAVTSTRNVDLVQGLGAERVIDYSKNEDFTRLPDVYDVILDAVANRHFGQCAPRLSRGGTYVTTLPSPANLAWLALTRIGLGGGKHAAMVSVQPRASDLAYLAALTAEGRIKPVIERTLPLAEAPAAFAASRGGHVRGKLVLSIGSV